ncbi:MAG: hypothetical protein IKN17_01675 [Ruminococcus sp.]|nr:hypothetical protein [Ruminococcus sp.]
MLELTVGKTVFRFTFSFFALIGLVSSVGGSIQKQVMTVLLCSLMHEGGHMTAMELFGLRPDMLTFYAGGIKLNGKQCGCGKAAYTVVLLSGCVVNLAAFALCLLLGRVGMFAAANLALGLFNLLPLRYFDGGRLYTELTGREPAFCIRIAVIGLLGALAAAAFMTGRLPISLIAAIVIILSDGILTARQSV